MNAKSPFHILLVCFWFVFADTALAQGFGGLGTSADGFDVPRRGRLMQFPADHGSHPGFRIEWWYVTANLTGADGRSYGVQWTLFRSALVPPEQGGNETPSLNSWATSQLWMGHAAVTTPTTHFVSETRSRGAGKLAGVHTAPFRAWINDWQMKAVDPEDESIDRLALMASGAKFAYSLELNADGPLVFHGQDGYSVKSAGGQASHYYSQPFYQVMGSLDLPEGPMEVTGTAWLDREWSSQPLSASQTGWDWVSLNLNDGSKLMGFRLRQSGGDYYTSATWISPTGQSQSYSDGHLQMEPLANSITAGRSLPTGWRVRLSDRNIDVTVEALNKDAWMSTSFPYWEGPVTIGGSHMGQGYLEMTGYGAD